MGRKLFGKGLEMVKFSDNLLLIMSIFTVTFFAYKDFDIRMLLGYGLLCVSLFLSFLRRLYFKKGLEVPSSSQAIAFVSVFTIFLMFLRPDSKHDTDAIVYIMSMIICSGFMLFAEPGKQEYGKILKVFIISAVAFCAFVLFFAVFEEFFWDSYFTIVSRASKVYLLKYVNRGYSPVLGGSCTITDYVIMLGIAFFVGTLLSKEKKGIINVVYLIPVLIFILAILIVGRRGELLSIGLTLVFIYGLTQTKKQLAIKLLILTALAILGIIIFVNYLEELKEISFLRRYVMTIENILEGSDTSSGRTELYGIAIAIFAKKKAPCLIEVTETGTVNSVIAVSSNALAPIVVHLLFPRNVTLASSMHPEKHLLPMLWTDSGIVTALSSSAPLNTLLPMDTTV